MKIICLRQKASYRKASSNSKFHFIWNMSEPPKVGEINICPADINKLYPDLGNDILCLSLEKSWLYNRKEILFFSNSTKAQRTFKPKRPFPRSLRPRTGRERDGRFGNSGGERIRYPAPPTGILRESTYHSPDGDFVTSGIHSVPNGV